MTEKIRCVAQEVTAEGTDSMSSEIVNSRDPAQIWFAGLRSLARTTFSLPVYEKVMASLMAAAILALIAVAWSWLIEKRDEIAKETGTSGVVGTKFTFLAVQAEKERFYEEAGLTIRSGPLTLQLDRPVVSEIEVIDRSTSTSLFTFKGAFLSGDNQMLEYQSKNCGFRLEIIPSLELIDENRYILGLSSHSLLKGGSPCPYKL